MAANASPKVSIITPCYNSEPWIRETIATVLAQTFADWEWLVIDDGSPDRTSEIVQEHNDPRIRILTQANAGVSAARNHGLAKARGEYLALLDHDDKWDPEFLNKLIAALDPHPEWAGVVCATQYFGGEPDQNVVKMPTVEKEYFLEHMLVRCAWAPVAALFRRLPGNPVRFNPDFPCADDWDFWKQMLLHGPFGVLHEVLAYYRLHPHQGSRKYYLMACRHLDAAEHFGRNHPDIIERYGTRRYHLESFNGAYLNLNDAQTDGQFLASIGILFQIWRRPPFPLWTVRKALSQWLPGALFAKSRTQS